MQGDGKDVTGTGARTDELSLDGGAPVLPVWVNFILPPPGGGKPGDSLSKRYLFIQAL